MTTSRDSLPAAAKQKGWSVRRDHGGGWHQIVCGSGIVRAEVFGADNALAVCAFLSERLGAHAEPQTKEDVVDWMFTKEAYGE